MTSRNSLMLASLIASALATPLAFAQDAQVGATGSASVGAQATPPATPTEDAGAMATPATPATPPSDDTTAMGATPATAAAPASGASVKAVNWSDLDTDKNGTLSKTEAASIASLSKSFDAADANKDGALTTDEYKAYLSAHASASAH